jgi:hypothetical protein
MAELISALDRSFHVGENGHQQRAWECKTSATDNNFEKDISDLYFQLVRSALDNDDCVDIPQIMEYTRLVDLYHTDVSHRQYLLSLLVQTRDIAGGKGEYRLFYGMLRVWSKYWHDYNYQLIRVVKLNFTTEETNFTHPYGSWKDVKYYLQTHGNVESIRDDPIALYMVELMVNQICHDTVAPDDKAISLAGKWAPRESDRKFGWQAEVMASRFTTGKGKMRRWRRTIANLNKRLGTTQVLQCGKNWSSIKFPGSITSITRARQHKAFICTGKNKSAEDDPDRQDCRYNYVDYVSKCVNGTQKMISKRLDLGEMVKTAINVKGQGVDSDAINTAWRDQSDTTTPLDEFIVMCDTSGSMTMENAPYHNAIGIALRIAERSSLGRRVMTFATHPSWIDLADAKDLTSMVKVVEEKARLAGFSTNFYAALKLIADACAENKMPADKVARLTLVVLSDMQINEADKRFGSVECGIREYFSDAGNKAIGEPYIPPTMVYWNMRTTKGMPTESHESKGTITISGYSMNVLDCLLNGDKSNLSKLTPWKTVEHTLNAERYSWFWIPG